MKNKLSVLKNIISKFSSGNKPYTIHELASFLACYNPYWIKDIKKLYSFINYWESKRIILKVSVEQLLKDNIINFIPEKCKYMYVLGSKGNELLKYLYPYALTSSSNKFNYLYYKLIIVSLNEVYSKLNKILCNSHLRKKCSKKTIFELLDSTDIFKIGRYYYITIAESRDELKKRLPYYPYITFECVKERLFNKQLNRNLEIELINYFQGNNDKVILENFVGDFKYICFKINEKKKILEEFRREKLKVLNNEAIG